MRYVPIVMVLLLLGCEGPAGPEGPEGPQGPPGAANIMQSTFTMRASEFSSSNDGTVETWGQSVSELADSIATEGLVIGYTDLGSDEELWYAMPYTLPVENDVVSINFAYATQAIAVQLATQSSQSVADAFDGHKVKVVMIPPSRVSDIEGKVDLRDYEAVVHALSQVSKP